MVNHFWESVDAILEDVFVNRQLFDAQISTERLSSFIVPTIMVVQQVQPGKHVRPNQS